MSANAGGNFLKIVAMDSPATALYMQGREEPYMESESATVRQLPEYAEFGAQIEAYGTRLLGDPERARDIVQETFIRLWQGKLQERQNVRAWLYRVARNLCLDSLRRQRRYVSLEGAELLYARDGSDPAQEAGDREEREIMLNNVRQLPPRQQEVLRLKFQENLSYAQIAEITGEPVTTVGWHLHEAMKSLRGKMAVRP